MPDIMLKTFLPQIHLFFGLEASKRANAISRLVSLWPTLLAHVRLAREDTQVHRLGTRDWRDIFSDFSVSMAQQCA